MKKVTNTEALAKLKGAWEAAVEAELAELQREAAAGGKRYANLGLMQREAINRAALAYPDLHRHYLDTHNAERGRR